MQIAVIFCFIGLSATDFLKGELTGYCLAVSALALSVLETLKIFKSEGDWKMFATEILACIFFVMFSQKIREHRKTEEARDGKR